MTSHLPPSTTPDAAATWREADSQRFLELGAIYTPRRDEIRDAVLDLIPAASGEAFTGVELGIGHGWLTDAILRRFPKAQMIGLDGSPTMLAAAQEALAAHGDRVTLQRFDLADDAWRAALPTGLRCVVSSLVIHHLDDHGKQRLFRDMFQLLAPGGALLIADLVTPTSEHGRAHLARAWNAAVERQSRELTGGDQTYQQFRADQWNIYEFPVDPDDVDHLSPLVDQLTWLASAGFTGIDVWWAQAGHALFGGYRPAEGRGEALGVGEASSTDRFSRRGQASADS